MSDQAQGLRNLVNTQDDPVKNTRVITVTSGKGGVGKSNFTINFALSLQAQGYKVLVFDADIGLANIDVLMGVSAQYNLYHLLKREKTIEEIICTGHNGLSFIAGGSGFNDLLNLSNDDLTFFVDEISKLNGKMDFIIFDTGAGLSKETVKFIVAADETIVVTTPEPTSITDAYAIIKMVNSMNVPMNFRLIVNRISHYNEGRQTADKISLVAKQFLQIDIPTLGYIYDDNNVSKAVKKQIPFSIAFPDSVAAKSISQVSSFFLDKSKVKQKSPANGIKGFLHRMMNIIK